MIDSTARMNFAKLVRQFLNGEITSTQFFESDERYQSMTSEDKALRAIDGMLWNSYSEDVPHKLLQGRRMLTQEGLDLYNRCLVFLGSDVEYEWPDDKGRFFQVNTLGPVVRILTLGMSYFIDRLLAKRGKSFMEEYRRAGEFQVWPFIRTSDFEKEQGRQVSKPN